MKHINKVNPIICPVCKSSGAFVLPKNVVEQDIEIKRFIAKMLFKKGYGIRQIQRALGYRSPQSISLIIKKNKTINKTVEQANGKIFFAVVSEFQGKGEEKLILHEATIGENKEIIYGTVTHLILRINAEDNHEARY